MASTSSRKRPAVPRAARVFTGLDAQDAVLPSEISTARKGSALTLALVMLCTVPVFWAANAAGVIGDVPSALAKGKGSSPGDESEDLIGADGSFDDEVTYLRTNQTSGENRSTRGTTRDHDTKTRTAGGTNDTSRRGHSTRGTTRDNDTRSNTLHSATGGATNT